MKKILAIALALVMVLAMVACGEKPAPTPDPDPTPDPEPTVITNADEIADEMTTEDGKYEIGFGHVDHFELLLVDDLLEGE